MKKIYYILALFMIFKAGAQSSDISAPDYASIELNITDPDSPYYYPKLFDKYTKADPEMTLEEKRHLYYGYALTADYAPFSRTQAEKDLYELLVQKDPGKKEYEKVLEHCNTILKNYPFSLRIKDYRIYCLKELGMLKEAELEMAQKEIIIDAVLSSGDGITMERSIYVINPVNEYEFIDLIGYEYAGKEQLIENRYDYLVLNENSYKVDGLFFDVSPCIKALDFTNSQNSVTLNTKRAD
jgi:hypothetical protein